jgi:predicted RNase H-like HicB family nuclease
MSENKKDLKYYLSLPWTYSFKWSDEDKAYIAAVAELKGCMSDGETIEEATVMIKEALECHIGGMLKSGCEIPEPIKPLDYSGKFVIRIEPVIHYKLDQQAKLLGKSLNKVVTEAVNYYLNERCYG